jgi:O-antigen/teichoic acid export membrane protein
MMLKEKVVRGVFWTALSKYLNQVLVMVGKIVLARLLVPEDFGLVAAASLAVGSIKSLSNFGIQYAIIHKKGNIKEIVETSLIFLSILSIINYILVYEFSSFFVNFFNKGIIDLIVKVIAIDFLISPFRTVSHAILNKELKFKEFFYVRSLFIILSKFLAVLLAIILPQGQKLWSLVLGNIFGELVSTIAAWKFSKLKLRFKFRLDVARELINYGKYFVGLSIVMYLYDHLDDFVIGKIISMTALGYYTFAYTFTSNLAINISSIFGKVALPLYAKFQDDTKSLKNTYLKNLKCSSLISTPLMSGLFILSPEFIEIIFGEKWIPATVSFQILSIFSLIRAVDTTTGELYSAIGRPKINQNLGIINLTGIVVLVYPLTMWYGIAGTALALVMARMITMYCNFTCCAKILNGKISDIFRAILPSILASSVMVICIYLIKIIIERDVDILGLFSYVFFGMFVYVVSLFFLKKEIFYEIIDLLRLGIKKSEKQMSEVGVR